MKQATVALSPSRLPGLDYALNPYTRCGHDCTYCYAPYIMRVPPGEWGGGVEAKENLPQLLDRELPRKRGTIGLGTVTDPYQPVEEALRLTRRCVEMLVKHRARVSVLTKSALVARDADLLSRLEGSEVGITVTTASDERAAIFEPCASPPSRRLEAMRALHRAGVPVYAFVGPIVPTVTDRDLDVLVASIKDAGGDAIMTDRLNLRPGMRERMLARMKEVDPASLPAFESAVGDDAYYREVRERLRQLCQSHGLACRDAF
jgi:DNA repair photolyase